MKDEYLSTRKMLEGVVREKNGFSAVFTHALKRYENKQRLTKLVVYCRLEPKGNFFSVKMTNPLEKFFTRRPAARETGETAS